MNGEHFIELRFGGDKYHASAGIGEDVGSLLRCQCRIDRNCNRAEKNRCEVGHRPLRPVFAEDGYAVAFADAPTGESTRNRYHVTVEISGRDRGPGVIFPVQHESWFVTVDNREEDVIERPETLYHSVEFPRRIYRFKASLGNVKARKARARCLLRFSGRVS